MCESLRKECERTMGAGRGPWGATQFSLNGNVTSLKRVQAITTFLHWAGQSGESKILQRNPNHSLSSLVNNYIINSVKREKSDSFVGRMYHAEQENELLFCCRLG